MWTSLGWACVCVRDVVGSVMLLLLVAFFLQCSKFALVACSTTPSAYWLASKLGFVLPVMLSLQHQTECSWLISSKRRCHIKIYWEEKISYLGTKSSSCCCFFLFFCEAILWKCHREICHVNYNKAWIINEKCVVRRFQGARLSFSFPTSEAKLVKRWALCDQLLFRRLRSKEIPLKFFAIKIIWILKIWSQTYWLVDCVNCQAEKKDDIVT